MKLLISTSNHLSMRLATDRQN